MKLRNISSRNLVLRDSSNNQYAVPAYSDTTVADTLWTDNEFRRWLRYRIRDLAVVDTSASVTTSTLIDTGNPSTVPFTVEGATGQTSDLTQWVNSSSVVLARVTASGWIGVGVSPLVPLHVEGPIGSGGMGQFRIDANASNTNVAISLNPNRSGTLFEAARLVATYNGSLQGQLAFYTGNGAGTLVQAGLFDQGQNLFVTENVVANNTLATQATIGTVSGNAGISFGSANDTSLYRSAANALTTPGALTVLGTLTAGALTFTGASVAGNFEVGLNVYAQFGLAQQVLMGSVSGDAGLAFGSAGDTTLYRTGAGVLYTPGTFNVAVLQVGGSAIASTNLSDSAALARLASPTFTGTPAAPTQTGTDNSTKIATTAFVQGQGYAPLASPALTGNPTAPTQGTSDNSTKIATTAYVGTATALLATLASPTFTGVPHAPTASPGTNTTQLATTAFVTAAAGSGGTAGQVYANVSGTPTWVTPGSYRNAPATPNNPGSNTGWWMMGLGGHITPTFSGRIKIEITLNQQTPYGCQTQGYYGTGTAPGNMTSEVGTGFGYAIEASTGANGAANLAVTHADIISVSAGTTYWIDVACNNGGNGGGPIDIVISAFEF